MIKLYVRSNAYNWKNEVEKEYGERRMGSEARQGKARQSDRGKDSVSLYLALIWKIHILYAFAFAYAVHALRYDYYRESLLLSVENTAFNIQTVLVGFRSMLRHCVFYHFI